MRYAPVLLLLAGCGGDVGFGSNTDNTVITGEAHMELSAEELVYEDLEVGKARSETLLVTSTSDHTLKIDSAKVMGPDAARFFLQEDEHVDVEVFQGQDPHEITIVCNLTELEPVEAYLRLDTNDADIPVRDIPLLGYPLGWTGDSDTDGAM
jgi:hypothetical protein